VRMHDVCTDRRPDCTPDGCRTCPTGWISLWVRMSLTPSDWRSIYASTVPRGGGTLRERWNEVCPDREPDGQTCPCKVALLRCDECADCPGQLICLHLRDMVAGRLEGVPE